MDKAGLYELKNRISLCLFLHYHLIPNNKLASSIIFCAKDVDLYYFILADLTNTKILLVSKVPEAGHNWTNLKLHSIKYYLVS